ADIAAAAARRRIGTQPDMTDVTRPAIGPTVQVPVHRDARADAGTDLQEDSDLAALETAHPELTQRHDLRVVLEKHGDAVALAHHGTERVPHPDGRQRS